MADSYNDSSEPLYDQTPGAYLHVEPDEVIPEHLDNPVYFLQQQENQMPVADNTGYMAVEPDWLSEQWDLLSEQPWFRGFQTREESERELRSCRPGGFVVRVSGSEPGHYAISCVQHGLDFDHMLILPSRAGSGGVSAPGNTRYRLGTYSRDLFNTVPKLIAYYIDHPYVEDRRLQGYVRPEHQPGGYMEVNPTAPSWLRGELSRQKAEELLSGAPSGSFILRTKRGQGHVLSMAQPPGAPKPYKHHLVKANDGQFFVDSRPVGRFAGVEQLISRLQSSTMGVIACPLVTSDFDDGFDDDLASDMANVGISGDVAAFNPTTDPLYDSAADGYSSGAPKSYAEDPYSDNPIGDETLESYRDIAPDPAQGHRRAAEAGYGDLPGVTPAGQQAPVESAYGDLPGVTPAGDATYGDLPPDDSYQAFTPGESTGEVGVNDAVYGDGNYDPVAPSDDAELVGYADVPPAEQGIDPLYGDNGYTGEALYDLNTVS